MDCKITPATSNSSQVITLQFGKLKYGYTSNVSDATLIGTSDSTYTNSVNTVLVDNISIDSTNTMNNSPGVLCIWLNESSVNSTLSNCFINATLASAGTTNFGNEILGGSTGTSTINILNNVILGMQSDFSSLGATTTVNIRNNIFSSGSSVTGSNKIIYLRALSGALVANVNNNIIYNCTGTGVYGIGIYGSPTVNEDYNDFYNNTNNSFQTLGAHSITVNPSLTNIATGNIDPSFAIPNGYAIVRGGALDKAGSDTFGNLGWDVTQYSPTGYTYASTDKINIGILYKMQKKSQGNFFLFF